MKKQTLFLGLLLLLALASCNTQKGGSSPEQYSYDDATSPLQGKLTYALGFGRYDFEQTNVYPTTFVVAEDGIYAKNTETNTWQQSPIPLPAGFENAKILDAMFDQSDSDQAYIYIAFEKMETQELAILALDPNNNGNFRTVTGLPSSVLISEFKFLEQFYTTIGQRDAFFTIKDLSGRPLLYTIVETQAQEETLSTPTSTLIAGDEIIGNYDGGAIFLVKIKQEAGKNGHYQLWYTNGQTPLVLSALKGKDIVFVGSANGFESDSTIMARNGESWVVERSNGKGGYLTENVKLISKPFADNFNPISSAVIYAYTPDDAHQFALSIGTKNNGYYELNVETNTFQSPRMSTNASSYQAKRMGTYTVTGFHFQFPGTLEELTYITTSNGVWVMDRTQGSQKLKGF